MTNDQAITAGEARARRFAAQAGLGKRGARPMSWRAARHAGGGSHSSFVIRHSSFASPAFTLLEVLLAMAVFALVLLAVHGVFYGALRLHQKTVKAIEISVPLQQALAIVKRDLAGLVVPGGTLFGELQTTDTASTNSSSSLDQNATMPGAGAVLQGLASPAFYTASSLISDAAPWGEVSKVYYHLAEPTNHTLGKDLFRSVTRNLLPTIQEQADDQWLLSGVDTIFFSFYDGTQWLETWDSTAATTKLPEAIRVHIQLASEETRRGLPEPVELVVPVMVQASTNQSTSATNTAEAAP